MFAMIFCFRFSYDFSAKVSMELPFQATREFIYTWVANRVMPMKVNNNTCLSKYRHLFDLHKQMRYRVYRGALMNVNKFYPWRDRYRRTDYHPWRKDFFPIFRLRTATWFYRIRKSLVSNILMSLVCCGLARQELYAASRLTTLSYCRLQFH